jgi:hypothetical protein
MTVVEHRRSVAVIGGYDAVGCCFVVQLLVLTQWRYSAAVALKAHGRLCSVSIHLSAG